MTMNKISLLVASRCQPDYLFDQMSHSMPVNIHIDMYSIKECVDIVNEDVKRNEFCVEALDATVLAFYVQSMVSHMYMYNPDLYTMKKKIRMLLPTFVKPIEEGKCSRRDARRLWSLFEATLHNSVNSSFAGEPSSKNESANEILPYDTNFILIAAYLASYNPPTSDARSNWFFHVSISFRYNLLRLAGFS